VPAVQFRSRSGTLVSVGRATTLPGLYGNRHARGGAAPVLICAPLRFLAPYIFKFQSPYDVLFAWLEHDRENPARVYSVGWRFSEKMMLHQEVGALIASV
jgi:hypothetical protein